MEYSSTQKVRLPGISFHDFDDDSDDSSYGSCNDLDPLEEEEAEPLHSSIKEKSNQATTAILSSGAEVPPLTPKPSSRVISLPPLGMPSLSQSQTLTNANKDNSDGGPIATPERASSKFNPGMDAPTKTPTKTSSKTPTKTPSKTSSKTPSKKTPSKTRSKTPTKTPIRSPTTEKANAILKHTAELIVEEAIAEETLVEKVGFATVSAIESVKDSFKWMGSFGSSGENAKEAETRSRSNSSGSGSSKGKNQQGGKKGGIKDSDKVSAKSIGSSGRDAERSMGKTSNNVRNRSKERHTFKSSVKSKENSSSNESSQYKFRDSEKTAATSLKESNDLQIGVAESSNCIVAKATSVVHEVTQSAVMTVSAQDITLVEEKQTFSKRPDSLDNEPCLEADCTDSKTVDDVTKPKDAPQSFRNDSDETAAAAIESNINPVECTPNKDSGEEDGIPSSIKDMFSQEESKLESLLSSIEEMKSTPWRIEDEVNREIMDDDDDDEIGDFKMDWNARDMKGFTPFKRKFKLDNIDIGHESAEGEPASTTSLSTPSAADSVSATASLTLGRSPKMAKRLEDDFEESETDSNRAEESKVGVDAGGDDENKSILGSGLESEFESCKVGGQIEFNNRSDQPQSPLPRCSVHKEATPSETVRDLPSTNISMSPPGETLSMEDKDEEKKSEVDEVVDELSKISVADVAVGVTTDAVISSSLQKAILDAESIFDRHFDLSLDFSPAGKTSKSEENTFVEDYIRPQKNDARTDSIKNIDGFLHDSKEEAKEETKRSPLVVLSDSSNSMANNDLISPRENDASTIPTDSPGSVAKVENNLPQSANPTESAECIASIDNGHRTKFSPSRHPIESTHSVGTIRLTLPSLEEGQAANDSCPTKTDVRPESNDSVENPTPTQPVELHDSSNSTTCLAQKNDSVEIIKPTVATVDEAEGPEHAFKTDIQSEAAAPAETLQLSHTCEQHTTVKSFEPNDPVRCIQTTDCEVDAKDFSSPVLHCSFGPEAASHCKTDQKEEDEESQHSTLSHASCHPALDSLVGAFLEAESKLDAAASAALEVASLDVVETVGRNFDAPSKASYTSNIVTNYAHQDSNGTFQTAISFSSENNQYDTKPRTMSIDANENDIADSNFFDAQDALCDHVYIDTIDSNSHRNVSDGTNSLQQVDATTANASEVDMVDVTNGDVVRMHSRFDVSSSTSVGDMLSSSLDKLNLAKSDVGISSGDSAIGTTDLSMEYDDVNSPDAAVVDGNENVCPNNNSDNNGVNEDIKSNKDTCGKSCDSPEEFETSSSPDESDAVNDSLFMPNVSVEMNDMPEMYIPPDQEQANEAIDNLALDSSSSSEESDDDEAFFPNRDLAIGRGKKPVSKATSTAVAASAGNTYKRASVRPKPVSSTNQGRPGHSSTIKKTLSSRTSKSTFESRSTLRKPKKPSPVVDNDHKGSSTESKKTMRKPIVSNLSTRPSRLSGTPSRFTQNQPVAMNSKNSSMTKKTIVGSKSSLLSNGRKNQSTTPADERKSNVATSSLSSKGSRKSNVSLSRSRNSLSARTSSSVLSSSRRSMSSKSINATPAADNPSNKSAISTKSVNKSLKASSTTYSNRTTTPFNSAKNNTTTTRVSSRKVNRKVAPLWSPPSHIKPARKRSKASPVKCPPSNTDVHGTTDSSSGRGEEKCSKVDCVTLQPTLAVTTMNNEIIGGVDPMAKLELAEVVTDSTDLARENASDAAVLETRKEDLAETMSQDKEFIPVAPKPPLLSSNISTEGKFSTPVSNKAAISSRHATSLCRQTTRQAKKAPAASWDKENNKQEHKPGRSKGVLQKRNGLDSSASKSMRRSLISVSKSRINSNLDGSTVPTGRKCPSTPTYSVERLKRLATPRPHAMARRSSTIPKRSKDGNASNAKPPSFLARNSTKKAHVKSTAELEEEEMSYYKEHPFKAQKIKGNSQEVHSRVYTHQSKPKVSPSKHKVKTLSESIMNYDFRQTPVAKKHIDPKLLTPKLPSFLARESPKPLPPKVETFGESLQNYVNNQLRYSTPLKHRDNPHNLTTPCPPSFMSRESPKPLPPKIETLGESIQNYLHRSLRDSTPAAKRARSSMYSSPNPPSFLFRDHSHVPKATKSTEEIQVEECKKQFRAKAMPDLSRCPQTQPRQMPLPVLTTPVAPRLHTQSRSESMRPPPPSTDEIELGKKFHALPLPGGMRSPEGNDNTPVYIRLDQYNEKMKEKKEKLMEEELAEIRRLQEFKARPLPIQSKPLVIEKSKVELVQPKPPRLSLDGRAMIRKHFDSHVHEKKLEEATLKQREEEQKRREEEEELKRKRKRPISEGGFCFHATPVRK